MTSFLLAAGIFLQIVMPGGECIRSNGRTICGFRCLTAHGSTACARTSGGICTATSVGVSCWDPPTIVRAHYKTRPPRPECICRQGVCECGFHCTAHGDDVRCASTPDGICRATSSGITCWDPPPTTYCANEERLPRPECIANNGKVACGYNCEGRNDQMACATTPAGVCTSYPDGIVCLDPEPPPMCGAEPCIPEPPERTWCPPPLPPEETTQR